MRTFKTIYLLGCFATMLVLSTGKALAQDQPTTGQDQIVRSAIEEVYRNFTQNLKDGNSQAIAEHYTEDAKFYAPTGETATGREEIKQVMDGFIQDGVYVDLEIQELEVFGNMAYEYGVATVRSTQGEELGQNQYVVLWKKDQGNWKMYRDFVK